MPLFESILDANHRAVAGDASAGLHPADFASQLPVIALTCIDPRLNAYFPNVLGLPSEDFIWLRNAGNLVTGPLTSTMRSLALACAVKGGREIAVIGHSDCQVCKTPTTVLLDRLLALGVERAHLPDNLSEFFGMFGSERQNVIKACDFIRHSPLIGPKIPVHGLLLDLNTGQLDWVVNGYQTLASAAVPPGNMPGPGSGEPMAQLGAFKDFVMGELKFPEAKIGELATQTKITLSDEAAKVGAAAAPAMEAAAESVAQVVGEVSQFAKANWPQPPPLRVTPAPLPPLKKSLPPPIRPGKNFRRG